MRYVTAADGTEVDRKSLRWDQEEDGITTLPYRREAEVRWGPDPEDPERVRFYLPAKERWKSGSDYWEPVLEGIQAGERLPAIRDRIADDQADRNAAAVRFILCRTISKLDRWGLISLILPLPPESFGGRYEVVQELGRGGMGVVWECRDHSAVDEENVAVKHAWNASGAFGGREEHLREEARLMGLFDHPYISPLLDTFEEDGMFHMVRPLYRGPRLSPLSKRERIPLQDRLRYTRQIAETANYMIGEGYLYADIKPGNYFLAEDLQEVRLADLGGCKALPESGELRGLSGTYAYMAPELFERPVMSERTLVCGLGRIHYQLATGRMPRAKKGLDYLRPRLEEAGVEPLDLEIIEAFCAPPSKRPGTAKQAVSLLTDAEERAVA